MNEIKIAKNFIDTVINEYENNQYFYNLKQKQKTEIDNSDSILELRYNNSTYIFDCINYNILFFNSIQKVNFELYEQDYKYKFPSIMDAVYEKVKQDLKYPLEKKLFSYGNRNIANLGNREELNIPHINCTGKLFIEYEGKDIYLDDQSVQKFPNLKNFSDQPGKYKSIFTKDVKYKDTYSSDEEYKKRLLSAPYTYSSTFKKFCKDFLNRISNSICNNTFSTTIVDSHGSQFLIFSKVQNGNVELFGHCIHHDFIGSIEFFILQIKKCIFENSIKMGNFYPNIEINCGALKFSFTETINSRFKSTIKEFYFFLIYCVLRFIETDNNFSILNLFDFFQESFLEILKKNPDVFFKSVINFCNELKYKYFQMCDNSFDPIFANESGEKNIKDIFDGEIVKNSNEQKFYKNKIQNSVLSNFYNVNSAFIKIGNNIVPGSDVYFYENIHINAEVDLSAFIKPESKRLHHEPMTTKEKMVSGNYDDDDTQFRDLQLTQEEIERGKQNISSPSSRKETRAAPTYTSIRRNKRTPKTLENVGRIDFSSEAVDNNSNSSSSNIFLSPNNSNSSSSNIFLSPNDSNSSSSNIFLSPNNSSYSNSNVSTLLSPSSSSSVFSSLPVLTRLETIISPSEEYQVLNTSNLNTQNPINFISNRQTQSNSFDSPPRNPRNQKRSSNSFDSPPRNPRAQPRQSNFFQPPETNTTQTRSNNSFDSPPRNTTQTRSSNFFQPPETNTTQTQSNNSFDSPPRNPKKNEKKAKKDHADFSFGFRKLNLL